MLFSWTNHTATAKHVSTRDKHMVDRCLGAVALVGGNTCVGSHCFPLIHDLACLCVQLWLFVLPRHRCLQTAGSPWSEQRDPWTWLRRRTESSSGTRSHLWHQTPTARLVSTPRLFWNLFLLLQLFFGTYSEVFYGAIRTLFRVLFLLSLWTYSATPTSLVRYSLGIGFNPGAVNPGAWPPMHHVTLHVETMLISI